jgi:hypothetical protein
LLGWEFAARSPRSPKSALEAGVIVCLDGQTGGG